MKEEESSVLAITEMEKKKTKTLTIGGMMRNTRHPQRSPGFFPNTSNPHFTWQHT